MGELRKLGTIGSPWVAANNRVVLGGTGLSKVQFGAEHARQMGDTYIDDVVVRR